MATYYFGDFGSERDRKTGLRKANSGNGYWNTVRRNSDNADRVANYRKAEQEGRAIPRPELKKLKGDTPVYIKGDDGRMRLNPANLDKDGAFDFRKFRQNNADRAEQRRTGIAGAKASRPSITINGRTFDNMGEASAFARETAANNKIRQEAIAAAKAFGLDKKGGAFDRFDVTNGEALTDDQRSALAKEFRSQIAKARQFSDTQKQGDFSTFKAEEERRAREAGGSPGAGSRPIDTAPSETKVALLGQPTKAKGGRMSEMTGGAPAAPASAAPAQSYRDRMAAERARIAYSTSAQGLRDAAAARLRDVFLMKERADTRKLIDSTKRIFRSAGILGIDLSEQSEA